jgi:hypothetical protein
MIKLLCLAGGLLAACCVITGVAVCQVVEPPPLPEESADAAPEEPFFDLGETLPPKALLIEMDQLYEYIKKQYKLHNYVKMEKRTRDLRNMAQNLRDKSQQTPYPSAFYGSADDLRNWCVKLQDAVQALNGEDMYQALRRVANRFNDCYTELGAPKNVSAGPRYDPPKSAFKKAGERRSR